MNIFACALGPKQRAPISKSCPKHPFVENKFVHTITFIIIMLQSHTTKAKPFMKLSSPHLNIVVLYNKQIAKYISIHI